MAADHLYVIFEKVELKLLQTWVADAQIIITTKTRNDWSVHTLIFSAGCWQTNSVNGKLRRSHVYSLTEGKPHSDRLAV